MLMLKNTVVKSPFEHTPLLPMSPLVNILGFSPPPGFPKVEGGMGGLPHLTIFFKPPPPPKSMPPHGVLLPIKNDAPHLKKNPPPIET